MSHRPSILLFVAALLALIGGVAGRARGIGQAATSGPVHALFDLSQPGGAPFPSDIHTVADQTTIPD